MHSGLIVAAAALGGLLFGYDTGVISGALVQGLWALPAEPEWRCSFGPASVLTDCPALSPDRPA